MDPPSDQALARPATSAIFSPCRTWRYEWRRTWDESLPAIAFIGLNPSTADETDDDPTVRRCIAFAKRWGYGGLVMLNIFAFKATKPKVMRAAPDPIGPDNDRYLAGIDATEIVAAWGVGGTFLHRDRQVLALVASSPWALALTKGGQPRHPLYVRHDVQRIRGWATV